MNFEEYLHQSERTEKKFEDGMSPNQETMVGAVAVLRIVEGFGMVTGQFKKQLIYGEDIEKTKPKILGLVERIEKHVDALETFEQESSKGNSQVQSLDQGQAETFHALLGMVSEVAEIIELIMPYIENNEVVDTLSFAEEIGDLYWYLAQFQRQFNLDEGTIRQKNIDKLRQRFPDRFDDELALNRDTEKEREVLDQ